MRAHITEEFLDRVQWTGNAAQGYVWDTELVRFGVVIGSKSQTFVINYRTGTLKRRKAIGKRGQMINGHALTVERARLIARELLSQALAAHHCPTCGQRLKQKR